jgi:hypothetical protein
MDNRYGNAIGHPLCFGNLPPEIHLRIMSYLNFREVQFLRATNSYFYGLLSPTDLARFRTDYAELLYQEELDCVNNPTKYDKYPFVPMESYIITREDKKWSEGYLTCFFCFRLLPIEHFATSQCTQRRRKGHIHAKKRFCEDCGVEKGMWQPGTELQFHSSLTPRVYCSRCRRVRSIPSIHLFWRRVHQGICSFCLMELENEGHTEDEITEIAAKLAKLAKKKK